MLLRNPTSPLDGPIAADGVSLPVARVAEASFASVGAMRLDQAVTDLVAVLEREREFLDPATLRGVEENLAIIDRAIERSLRALSADPESEFLQVHVEQSIRHKLTLLQSVTAISSAL